MTHYIETSDVAHVVEREPGGRWHSLCCRGRRKNYRYRDPMNLAGSSITYGYERVKVASTRFPQWHVEPTKPWCAHCIQIVDQLARDVGLIS